ncbi:MAG TPA: hypothetical protein VHP83_25390, partial [Aggregatilineaceae bacterium]|nr:hypothetical protein [Aggregatilineaceae bacterium]
NRWLKVRLEDGSEVWVGNSNGLPIEGNLDSVPVEAGMAVVVVTGMGIWTYAEPAGTLLDPVRNGRLPILARTADNRWLKVRLEDGSEVWVGNSNGLPIEGSLDSVPIQSDVILVVEIGVWTYANPGTTPLAVVSRTRLPIIGRTADNRWLKVRLEDGSEVWVGNSSMLTIEGSLDSVPVAAG